MTKQATSQLFQVKLTFPAIDREYFVCDQRTQWDFSWYTRNAWEAKQWKTRGGAERWIKEHLVGTTITGCVHEVELKSPSKRGR